MSTPDPANSLRPSCIDVAIAKVGPPAYDYYKVVRDEPSEECFARARAKLEPLEKSELIELLIEASGHTIHLEDRAKIAELEWARAEREVRNLRKQLDEKTSEVENLSSGLNKKEEVVAKKPKVPQGSPRTPTLLVANEIFERFNIDSETQNKFYETRKLNFALRQIVLERFVARAQSETIMSALQNKPFKASQVFVQCQRSVEHKPRKPSDIRK